MMTDRDAIIKVKNGEIDSFSYIVKKYTPSIYGFISKKLSKKEDAEDLVQNVFISFYKAIDRFDINKPVKPYLFQIVQNELKMFYRKHKTTLSLKEEIYIEEKNEDVFADQYLKNLDNEEKKMIIMIADGYPYEEVAKKFKKPINTVKSIIRRARLKLRSVIPSEARDL